VLFTVVKWQVPEMAAQTQAGGTPSPKELFELKQDLTWLHEYMDRELKRIDRIMDNHQKDIDVLTLAVNSLLSDVNRLLEKVRELEERLAKVEAALDYVEV
jgi:chromosome segregation ATPase